MKKLSVLVKIFFVYLFLLHAANADVPAGQVKEVNHLLAYVKNSGCVINRNGTDHPAEKGKEHIEKKYDYFRDDIKNTEEFIESVKKNLLLEMVKLLKPQVNQIHNIRVWNLAALGSIALFVDDKELYSWCYNSEFGIKAQLEKGVTVDGFWYEGSIFYNFFLLEGMVTLLLLSEVYGTPFKTNEKNIIAHMLERAYMYTFDSLIRIEWI